MLHLINELRQTLNRILRTTAEIKCVQNEIVEDLDKVKEVIRANDKKFMACKTAFEQTKEVCEELTERISDAAGILSRV